MRVRHVAPPVVGLFVLLAAAGAEPPAPAAPAAADTNTAEKRYKNIQVLKGYPADELVPAMQFITNALGVDCEYCHVEHAPEKDDKKTKLTARKMMAMTFAINRDNFNSPHAVTCVSCHRGASRPISIPAVADGSPQPEPPSAPPAPKATAPPAAAAVLDAYVRAVGGLDAIAKIESRIQKGKLSGFGPEPIPVEVRAKAPDKRITTVHSQRGDSITAFDGRSGWLGSSDRPPRDMSATESAAVRLDAMLLFPSDLRRVFEEFEVAPSDAIDGKDTVKLIAKNPGRPPAELWFDAGSGLVVRLVRYAETPLGRNPTQIDYADYREADGIKFPFRWTVARPNGRFTIQIDESQQNVPIEDAAFEKPAPPPS